MRSRFGGEICAFGTTSGVRVVIGRWETSPYGCFSDVMIERADGHRLLLAPDRQVADYVAATYSFDEVLIGPVVTVRRHGFLGVDHARLVADVHIGHRTGLGRLLRAVPRRIATNTTWCTVIDPLARTRGVRTRGSAGNARREWYGATDMHALKSVTAQLDGSSLGPLADVWPPVRFGFGSAPRRPSIVDITTTVDAPASDTRESSKT